MPAVLMLQKLLQASLSLGLLVLCACATVAPHGSPKASGTTAGHPNTEEVDVYLLAGQSNMVGVGRAERLPESALRHPNVFLYHSSAVGAPDSSHRWLPLRPAGQKGLWREDGSQGFGVELSLGSALARAHPQRKIYLIKHAVGGSSLFSAWNPGNGKQFQALVTLLERAFEDLATQGLRPVVRGVFWQQGERDSMKLEMAGVYEQRLENFIVRLRSKLAAYAPDQTSAKIRFVLGQVIPDAAPGSVAERKYPHRATIRAAQLAVPMYVANAAVVPTNESFDTHVSDGDDYRSDDNIHFNSAGITKLGEHMAAAYLAPPKPALQQNRPALASLQPRDDVLRVLAYNTYYVFSKGEQVDAATEWIASKAPDLVALQELTNIPEERLTQLATGWGHDHSALLKTNGFSVGLTSSFPIEVVERVTAGLHHGCLHARVAGIEVFVVHLSPFRWAKRQDEAEVLLSRIQPLIEQGADVLVLGDFNAHSPADRDLLESQPELLQKYRNNDATHDHVENLRNGQFHFATLQRFLDAGLEDAALPYLEQSRGLRWTFPSGYWSEERTTAPAGGERIDYILTSPSLTPSVVSAYVPRHGVLNRTSDHYPLLVEFHRAGWE